MDAETSFNHEIDRNPKREDACTIKIDAIVVDPIRACPTSSVSSRTYAFVKKNCGASQVLKAFLTDAGIDTQVLLDLYIYVDGIVHTPFFPRNCALSVRMTIDPQIEEDEDESVQVSFDETNIGYRPANQLLVMSLNKTIYNKTTSSMCDSCTICLEEFGTGDRVVTLPCGHVFDHRCIVDWFRTSHVCPLCRFKLPYEKDSRRELGFCV